jgi:antitoxin (DNA-binding transcriptional repressor) of toxin-antitoxin stability system
MDVEACNTGEIRVGVRELRGSLTQYLHEAARGVAVLVTSHDRVIAEIRAPAPGRRPERRPGALRGQIRMADDFDTMPSELLDAMEA